MKRNLLFFILIAVVNILSEPLIAQGTHWLKLPTDSIYSEPYFINDSVGFLIHNIEATTGLGHGNLLRTIDAGMHWNPVNDFDPITGSIFQIYFSSSDRGFITYANPTFGKAHRSSVFETNDSGLHWNRICSDSASNSFSPALGFYSVYASTDAIFTAGEGYIYGLPDLYNVLLRSQNEGKSWDTLIVAKMSNGQNIRPYVFGNKDSTVFMESYLDYSHKLLFSSSDNGSHWATDTLFYSPENLLGVVGIYSIPHTNELLTVFGDSSDSYLIGDSASIQHSSDFGRTWEKYAQLPCGNWICGDECTLYVCNADCIIDDKFIFDTTVSYAKTDINKIGMYFSKDRGKSWSLIPDISFEEFDDIEALHNFCVTMDGTIYATGYTEVENHGDNYALWRLKPDSVNTSSSYSFSSTRIIKDSFNVTVHLPIYFHRAGTVSDVDMIMHFPLDGALQYLNGISYNGKSLDVIGGQSPGRSSLHFSAADINAAPDSLLGYVNFQWTPFEFNCDEIIFDSINIHGLETPCYFSENAMPFKGVIGSYQSCDQSKVPEAEAAANDFSIYPNPASRKVEISVSDFRTMIEYELFNSLGVSVEQGISYEKLFRLDLSKVISGNYYLRVHDIVGGKPQTKILKVVD